MRHPRGERERERHTIRSESSRREELLRGIRPPAILVAHPTLDRCTHTPAPPPLTRLCCTTRQTDTLSLPSYPLSSQK